jgi:hypothetical protein
VLEYTSLFSDLEELFRSAGRDPNSFRRLAREVDRAAVDLREYTSEVAGDYAQRLEARLADPAAEPLSEEERSLLRGFLNQPAPDAERDQRALEAIGRLEECKASLLLQRDKPLSLRSLETVRTLLARMRSLLPGIVADLEDRNQAQRFDDAVSEAATVDNREWLLDELRRALEE